MPRVADKDALSETDPAHVRAARRKSLFDKSEGGRSENLITHCGALCFQKLPALTGKPDTISACPARSYFRRSTFRKGGVGHGRLQIAEQTHPHFGCQLRPESRTHSVSVRRQNSPLMSQRHTGPDRQSSRGNRESARECHHRNLPARTETSDDALKRANPRDEDDPCMTDRSCISSICHVESLNVHGARTGQHRPDAAVHAAACPPTNTREMPRKRQS